MAYRTTTNHDEIQRFVQRYGGRPAIVKGTSGEDAFGALRIDFTDDPNLDDIDWYTFLDRFEANNLALRYDEDIDGPPEDMFKLVDRDDTPMQPEDESEMPDAQQDMAAENMYPDAAPEHEYTDPNVNDGESDHEQNVW